MEEIHTDMKLPLLTKGTPSGQYTTVDIEFGRALASTRISLNKRGYATFSSNGKTVLLHRHIISATPGTLVDHINNDKLDNRKSNLRFASHSLNLHNREKRGTSSQYRGVCFMRSQGKKETWADKWECQISKRRYTTEVEAAISYNYEAKKKWGDHARLNNVEMPENWCPIQKTIREKRKGSVVKTMAGRFSASYKKKTKFHHVGTFNTRLEAEEALDRYFASVETPEIVINRRDDGVAALRMPCERDLLLDDDDYLFYIDKGVHVGHNGYPANARTRKQVHREILGPRPGFVCDHINGDIFDCRRINLREATYSQNSQNRAGRGFNKLKGVTQTGSGNFAAHIMKNGKNYSLGTYLCANAAAYAYNFNALKIYGDKARINSVSTIFPTTPHDCSDGTKIFFVVEDKSILKGPRSDCMKGIAKTKYGRYVVTITLSGKKKRAGTFETLDMARFVYDVIARKYLGDKAKFDGATKPEFIVRLVGTGIGQREIVNPDDEDAILNLIR